MFRNNYDNDSVTFSPQGRIFQIEYAGEAVKQGSVAVGIVSKTHVVLCAVKRNAEELSSYQKKIFPIHDHAGLVMAGLTSDARVLTRFMNTQSLGHTLTYGRSIPISTLVSMVGSKAQINTQAYGKRPYGVGMLIAGMDENGAHLFQIEPSGATEEMIAFAIGARSQMARTYLEKNSKEFADCSREELIIHGLKALRESLPQDKTLTVENTSVGIVGVNDNGDLEPFRVHDDADVLPWIESSGNEPETASTMEVDP